MASRKDSKGRVLHAGESQRKDGTYQYRYTNLLGKRCYKYAPTLQKLRELEEDIQKSLFLNLDPSSQNFTLNNMFERFMLMKKGQVRDGTMLVYQTAQRLVQKYPIGNAPLSKLRATEIKTWLFQLNEEGYAQSTVSHTKNVLHGVFELAVLESILNVNPCRFRLTFKEKEPSKKFAMSQKQQKDFLAFVEKSDDFCRFHPFFVILLGTGIRLSEILGLTINDVDFASNKIHITHQLYNRKSGSPAITKPKTQNGVRSIPMSKDVRIAMKKVFESKPKHTEAVIDGHYGFLFVNPYTAYPYVHSAIRAIMRRAVEAYRKCVDPDFPYVTPHIFRHTFASNMINAGMKPKTLQYLLGHAKIATTMDIYTHISSEQVEEAMEDAEWYFKTAR